MEPDESLLKYYLDEAKHTQEGPVVEEYSVPDEAELATDFLSATGFSHLTKLHQRGEEIPENIVSDSVRQKNLTETQAKTIRNRVATLNKTLKSRQPRRKHRLDIRDISWDVETSSTSSRSRSATPDSLDSIVLNEPLSSDDDQPPSSLPPFPLDLPHQGFKTKVKWTSSEPIQNKKFNRTDKSNVARLGSDNVVLKGYQPLNEYGTLPRPQRERSGSDPTTELTSLQPMKTNLPIITRHQSTNLHNQLSRSHNSITISNNCSKVYINSTDSNEDEAVSFEGLIKQNDVDIDQNWILQDGVSIDELTDSEYQHLHPLLYVELVAIFDSYKIKFIKRKASIKNKGGNVFGLKLSTLVMRDMPTDDSMIPKIFQSVIGQLNKRCLSEDGILRIAGQKQKLEFLCQEIEAKFFSNIQEVENLLSCASVHDLTGILKKLLRDLPDPIFTMELFDMFFKTSAITKMEDRIKALNLLVLLLPVEHRNTFRLLMNFFLNIIKYESQNRMNLHNVAMITAPSFFPPRLLLPKDNKFVNKTINKDELHQQINDAALCCKIMETMLKTGPNLWSVPKHLAKQAKDAQKRALDRKDMSKDKKNRSGKTKLVRSNTHHEAGAINVPRYKSNIKVKFI
ncbi:rho GTPase-activating protein conundrum-like [Aethina tumida]|uniref:rho GTPase-activating protein conundrum-like n=1 Tax=Aethina tumida TaxID=116153 RepID=UPI002147817A|nr:rho GTPase-activating protein conundrum-like [Aethina tumida]XP_049817233.1 rho GTPase-activating protein conundrum-like [Aethina tumida]